MSESSSLPEPGDLERYERVLPGSAARIVALAERRSDRDLWVQRLLAREERLTRLMSYGSLVIGICGASVGIAAFLLKALEH
jgi:uncharacterized membrane protein